MAETDHILRGILAAMTLAALLLSGSFFGTIWPERGWPIRVISCGLFGVLLYGFVIQIKAFNLGIPFDGYSFVGLVAYTILVAGLVWFIRDRNNHRRR